MNLRATDIYIKLTTLASRTCAICYLSTTPHRLNCGAHFLCFSPKNESVFDANWWQVQPRMCDKPIKCSPSSEKVKFSVSFAKDKAEVNCLWHTASSDVREIIKVLETVWTDRANGLGFVSAPVCFDSRYRDVSQMFEILERKYLHIERMSVKELSNGYFECF